MGKSRMPLTRGEMLQGFAVSSQYLSTALPQVPFWTVRLAKAGVFQAASPFINPD